jgi:hypothetical protein
MTLITAVEDGGKHSTLPAMAAATMLASMLAPMMVSSPTALMLSLAQCPILGQVLIHLSVLTLVAVVLLTVVLSALQVVELVLRKGSECWPVFISRYPIQCLWETVISRETVMSRENLLSGETVISRESLIPREI